MKKPWLLLLLPAALLMWWGLSRRQSAVTVHVSTVAKTKIESFISTNGKVEPAEWAAARAVASGVVNAVNAQRGEYVSSGQPLVTLDMSLVRSELQGALAKKQQAQVEASILNQGGKSSALASLDDSLKVAQETVAAAQRNYDSLVRLLPQQAATKVQVDEAKVVLDRAQLQAASIEHQRQTLVTSLDKAAAEAHVSDAQSQVDLAAQRLKFGIVGAPISGVLYQFDLRQGAYLQEGDLVGLVGKLDRMKVIVYVDEPDLGRVAMGMPVVITWEGLPGKKWSGHVDRLPTEVTALGTRTVGEVTTIVENPNHDLLPGVTVNATIVSRVVNDAISIPKAALRNIRGQTGVYKVAGDHLQWTPVKSGASDISNVEVLSGVSPGDKVADRVVDPSDAELKDELRVKVEPDSTIR